MKGSQALSLLVAVFTILTIMPLAGYARVGDPNFILINTDDMNTPEMAFMPNVQTLLVEQGITFNNAFVTTPNCCPSRASLLRGQYAHNTGVLTNLPPNGGFEVFRDLGLESSTIATWMQRFQFRTGLIGKYLNGYGDNDSGTYVPPGWDSWYALVSGQSYYGYRLSENGSVVQYSSAEEDYQTDVLAAHALDFVKEAVIDKRSFFLYITPAAPHSPFFPAIRHQDAFPDITTAPRPSSFNEADVSDKPLWIQEKPLMSDEAIADIDENYRKRLQMLLAVDEMVASLVNELETQGILDNTYIIFTSDNGWFQGEHRLEIGKRLAYDESIRVPLVIRGPGVPIAQQRDQVVLHIDLGATLIDLLVSRVPKQVDGRSLAPLLAANPPPRWRNQFLVEHAGDGKAPAYNAIRTIDHLYVEWLDTPEIELYDMILDPTQIDSIHDTASQDLLDELSLDMDELVQCERVACRKADH